MPKSLYLPHYNAATHHTKFQDNLIINEGVFFTLKSYFEKNAIEVRNRKKTVLSTDEKISILGA